MARADSTIRVNIIGDAKSLQKAAATSEGAVGGLNKKLLGLGTVVAGAFAADALVDFGNTAVKEADRVADAAGRVEASLGPDLSKAIIDRADEFARFGASEGDMLELVARLTDIGTAAGLSAPDMASFAENAAAIASALEGATDTDAATWIEKIGKAAATGNTRALQDLGIFLDDAAVAAAALAKTGKDSVDALTDQELAAARTDEVMRLLNEKYGDLLTTTPDLEGKQRDLQARFETLTGRIGAGLEGPLSDLLGWILAGIDGWAMLSEKIGGFDKAIADALTPVARMIDAQRELINVIATSIGLLQQLLGLGGQVGGSLGAGAIGSGVSSGIGKGASTVNVNVQGGSPEVIEQAVRNAIQHATGRGPLE